MNADAAGKTYDGEAVNESAFVVTATTANYPLNKATVTYSYKKVTGYDSASNPITQVVEGAPTDAGTYLVTATAVRRGYANATATAQFTIAPKEVTISVTGAVDSITYGDTLPTLGKEVVGVLEGEDLGLTGDYQIVKDGTAVTEAVPNAGVYTISGNFVATNQNYTITPETKAFTILKKDLEDVDDTIEIVSELTNAIADYGVTGAPAFTVVYKAQTGNKTLVSDVANPEAYDYAVNAPTVLADGNYTIEVVGEGNYTGIREISWKVTETDETKEAARAAIAEAAKVEFTDFTVASEANKKIGVAVKGSVESPEGKEYKIIKTGLLYYRSADTEPDMTKLTVENVDKVSLFNTSRDNQNSISSVIKDTYDNIYFVGYIVVTDGTYNVTKYTSVVNTSVSRIQNMPVLVDQATSVGFTEFIAGTSNKVGVKLHSSIAEESGLTLKEAGVLYYREADAPTDAILTVENGKNKTNGVKVVTGTAEDISTTIKDTGNGIYFKGYMIVVDNETGIEYTKYTETVKKTFDEVNAEQPV